ncbi:MAG: 4-hydroxy-tetrahydrodipicolinate reductase [Gemmatimonadota bacterium]
MKIALLGYGRMGREVESVALQGGHEIVLRVDPDAEDASHLDGDDVDARLSRADAAIDFSVASAVAEHVARAVRAGTNVVVGTTGWEDDMERVRRMVEGSGIGLLYGPNFSLGAHLFFRLAELAGELAGRLGQHDVHLVETHHRHKRDHPSGTAKHVADLLVRVVDGKERWERGPVPPDSSEVLQVTSIRAGEVAGIHVVGLDGADDRIEVRHEARGRTGFARGAIEAAEWLAGRKGYHTIDDLLDERFDTRETDR